MEQFDHNRQVQYRALNDAVIRYVLCRSGSEEKLKAFLNAIFVDQKNEDVSTIEELSIINPFDPTTFSTDKQDSMNFFAKDKNQREFYLAFQVCNHSSFIEQGLFHWSQIYFRQLENRNNRVKPVVSIIVTDYQNP